MSCTYQSVTLQAGQSLVLPPGATLVSATDPGLITSENECAADEIANLETPVCYKFRFSGALDDDSNRTENWDEQNYSVNGITIADVYYPFASSFQGWQNASSWTTALNSITALNGLFTLVTSNFGYDSVFLGASRGWTNLITLNVIPSIGDSLQFNISTVTESQTVVPDGSSSFASVSGELCDPAPLP